MTQFYRAIKQRLEVEYGEAAVSEMQIVAAAKALGYTLSKT